MLRIATVKIAIVSCYFKYSIACIPLITQKVKGSCARVANLHNLVQANRDLEPLSSTSINKYQKSGL